ncbi:DMT family transporter [Acidaminobacter hydrogenoformans]|uniref:Permease of the drug/metabolite transporter (DMT) superfamily n=1 Tax=Acidaminobacter hydrogenoformans DSM 2784 TaxID=1120920 RepID=A0A1G5S712_9FIRM|nr:DMT family transporter [Acidaminobacter hydrogenoformans]SCZ81501.1 Permease of the drug/metabolite transporter (DMT) superfamily [Acidaminobacter hydrogenoformans DSM 2784]
MNKNQLKADLALLFVTVSWGASFLLTKNALDGLETFNFLAVRFGIATLISVLFFFKDMIRMSRKTLVLGIGVGALMFTSYGFQTVGITMTTVSKSAFITGTSVLMVPMFAALFLKRMPDRSSLLGAFMAFVGLGLMTLTGASAEAGSASGLNLGDFLTLLCAVGFALYILAVGKYTTQVDSVPFAIVQLGTVAVFSAVTSLAFETPIVPSGGNAWFAILFLAIVCTSMAFIVQNVAQKYTTSTHTALIFSGEPVFAAMFAYVMIGEVLGMNGILGGGLILLGMLVAELNVLERLMPKKRPSEAA